MQGKGQLPSLLTAVRGLAGVFIFAVACVLLHCIFQMWEPNIILVTFALVTAWKLPYRDAIEATFQALKVSLIQDTVGTAKLMNNDNTSALAPGNARVPTIIQNTFYLNCHHNEQDRHITVLRSFGQSLASYASRPDNERPMSRSMAGEPPASMCSPKHLPEATIAAGSTPHPTPARALTLYSPLQPAYNDREQYVPPQLSTPQLSMFRPKRSLCIPAYSKAAAEDNQRRQQLGQEPISGLGLTMSLPERSDLSSMESPRYVPSSPTADVPARQMTYDGPVSAIIPARKL